MVPEILFEKYVCMVKITGPASYYAFLESADPVSFGTLKWEAIVRLRKSSCYKS